MPTYMLLYTGPPTTPATSHQGWPEWLGGLGDQLVDMGSPMKAGFVVRGDGVTTDTAESLLGFSLVRAADREAVRALLRTHPLLAAGDEYRIDVFEVPAK
jgi:hypothetical protein